MLENADVNILVAVERYSFAISFIYFFLSCTSYEGRKELQKRITQNEKKKDFMKSISKFPSKYKIQFLFLNIIFNSSISKLYIYKNIEKLIYRAISFILKFCKIPMYF